MAFGSTGSKSETTSNNSGSSGTAKRKKWDTKRLLKIFYWLIIVATVWFCWLNIAPYAAIVKIGMVKTADPNLLRLIGMIPVVNSIAAILGASLHLIIGTLLWAVIQTLEVLPMLLKRDPSFVKEVVNNNDKHSKYAEKPDDDPVLTNLKRYYNQFPILAIKQAKNLMLFAYTIDLLICITIYPPVSQGGIGKLMFILMTGQFQLLNYSNLILLAVTLFIVEFMLKLLFFVGQIGWYMKKAHSN